MDPNSVVRLITATGVPTLAHACASATATAAQPSLIVVGQGNDQPGEAGAALSEPFRVWVSDGRNGIPFVPVTFTIITGNGILPSGGSAVTALTGPTGHAEADFVLGLRPGSNFVRADFRGNSAGVATFVATGQERDPVAGTRFSGVVFSNGSQPICGATCRLILPGRPTVTLTTTSDVEGGFEFNAIPTSGAVDHLVDGSTATQVGGQSIPQGSYPNLHYTPILVDGSANSLSGPVFLPALDPANARLYDGTQDVELGIAGVEGLRMVIKAGSMTNPDGSNPSPSNPVQVSLNQVHTDNIPMPIGDGAAPPVAWTLQPSGAHFDPPVEVIVPNMRALPAGAVVNFMSFNHDTGKFEIVAPGHVLPDGSCCVTDPGHGLRVAGWGGVPPPPLPKMTVTDCQGEPNGCGPEGGIKVPDSLSGVFDFTTACADLDLVVLNSLGDDVSILENDGQGGFTTGTPIPVNANSRSLAIADLDADGIPDLLVGSNDIGSGVEVFLGAGDRTFVAAPTLVGIGRAMDLTLADLDADGTLDLVVGDINNTKVFFGNGDGTFGATVVFNDLVSGNKQLTLGDADGDGDLDLFIPRSSDFAYIENTGAGTFAAIQSIPADVFSSRDVVTGDVNGDGFLDVVTGSNFNHRVVVILGNGNGTFAPAATYSLAGAVRSVALVDLDGDGDLDIASSVPGGLQVSRNHLIRP